MPNRRSIALLLLTSCGGWDRAAPSEPEGLDAPLGLRVAGNRIEDANGNPVVLRGVNRSGSEYRCIQNRSFFDGPSDEASILAMQSWNINAVRVPLNEACWLAINDAPPEYSGEPYKRAIQEYVELLNRHDLVAILDLHWTAPDTFRADRLQPMPNVDHSIDFWRDVATTFRRNEKVVFEPFNEPFPHANRDSVTAWECWRDGCMEDRAVRSGDTSTPYAAAGLQSLVSTIRQTGAKQLILLGGVQYSNALSQWLTFRPFDPLDNVAAAWHVYNTNPCSDANCWAGVPAELSAEVPLVVTELGQNDCTSSMVEPLLGFLDQHGASYLAWAWNAYGPCTPFVPMQRSNPWSLVTDYTSATPNSEYALAVQNHLLSQPP